MKFSAYLKIPRQEDISNKTLNTKIPREKKNGFDYSEIQDIYSVKNHRQCPSGWAADWLVYIRQTRIFQRIYHKFLKPQQQEKLCFLSFNCRSLSHFLPYCNTLYSQHSSQSNLVTSSIRLQHSPLLWTCDGSQITHRKSQTLKEGLQVIPCPQSLLISKHPL